MYNISRAGPERVCLHLVHERKITVIDRVVLVDTARHVYHLCRIKVQTGNSEKGVLIIRILSERAKEKVKKCGLGPVRHVPIKIYRNKS